MQEIIHQQQQYNRVEDEGGKQERPGEGGTRIQAQRSFQLSQQIELVQQAGLITLKADANPLRVSELDVAQNPKKIKLVPLDAAHLPRSLDDVQFAIINGNFAISSGLKLKDAVLLEKTPDHYLNIVAVKTKDAGAQWAKDLEAAFRSAEFKKVVDAQFAGYAKPAFLQ